MTIQVLNPDGTISNSNWTVTGASAHAALNDASDGTFVTNTTANGELRLTFGTFAIPAGSYVKDMYLSIRGNTGGAVQRNLYPYMYTTATANSELAGSTVLYSGSGGQDLTSIGFGAAFSGQAPTQTEIDALAVRLSANATLDGTSLSLNLYKLSVNVIHLVLPTVTASTIAFGGSGVRPTVTWTTVNPDLLTRIYYRVKIFTAAQAAGLLFFPDADTPVWDSGDVLSFTATPSTTVTTDLVPGTSYIIYVKVGDVTGWTTQASSKLLGQPAPPTPVTFVTNGIWYASPAQQLQTIAPARPLLALTDEPNNVTGGPRVRFNLTTQDNLLTRAEASDYFIAANAGWFPFASTTVVDEAVAGAPLLGTTSLRLTRNTSTGDLIINTDYAGAAIAGPSLSNQVLRPVVAGRTYAAIAQVKSAATSRTAQVFVDWFNSSGTFLSTTTPAGTTTSTSAWKLVGASFVAPANSAFMRMGLRVNAAVAGEVHYYNLPVFRPYDNADNITTDGVIHPAGPGFSSLGNMIAIGTSSFEANTGVLDGVFFASSGVAGNNWSALSSTIGAARLGARGARMTAGGAGNCYATTAYDSAKPIGAGVTSLYLSIWARPQTTNYTVYCFMDFYDAQATLISRVVNAGTAMTTGSFQQTTLTVAVPANATRAAPGWGFIATAVSDTCDLDTVHLAQTAAGPYNPGGVDETGLPINNDGMQRVFYVEKSADGGVTWVPVREGTRVSPTGTAEPQTFQGYDYEIVSNTLYQYRASVIGYYQGVAYQSAYYTANITPAVTSSGTNPLRWWFKDPITAANSMQADIVDESFHYKVTEAQAMYDPLGRNRNIVVSDVVYGKEFALTLDFLLEAEYDAWIALRNRQRVLLLQRPWNGDQWYIRVRDAIDVTEFNTTPIRYQIALTAVEVDVP